MKLLIAEDDAFFHCLLQQILGPDALKEYQQFKKVPAPEE